MALLASSIVGVILFLSPSSAAASAYDEAKNLPPTVFSPTGRLFGVELVAHEAAKMTTLSYDNNLGYICSIMILSDD
jgi:hypothetical protein